MDILFEKISGSKRLPDVAHSRAFLQTDGWDDFGFKTLFTLTIFDLQGKKIEIGNVKIAFRGQAEGATQASLGDRFEVLPEHFFSLGQDAEYYSNLVQAFPSEIVSDILRALRDVVVEPECLARADNETVFNTSLLRTVNRSTIEQQYQRILCDLAPLTDYHFNYYLGDISLEFLVVPNKKPSSNIHILIGRNGVGKTTILNNMVNSLLQLQAVKQIQGNFTSIYSWGLEQELPNNYFAGLVSLAFSAFDPFEPPTEQQDGGGNMRYHYIGIKKQVPLQNGGRVWGVKNKSDFAAEFVNSLSLCLSLKAKKERWLNAVSKLESDANFAEMNLGGLLTHYDSSTFYRELQFEEDAKRLFLGMSSGHSIVLLSITKLVETVEEKTLVLLDEPESHLHPPLLSAFTRALSDLLLNRNGVAVIATHSPVVLQEVPASCVSVLSRVGEVLKVEKPEQETFAENVGVLTRDVFGLEVAKSGFHNLLQQSVDQGKSYDEIIQEYQSQLGFEGMAILRAMIIHRDGRGIISEEY